MNNYTFKLSDLFLESSYYPAIYTREEIERLVYGLRAF